MLLIIFLHLLPLSTPCPNYASTWITTQDIPALTRSPQDTLFLFTHPSCCCSHETIYHKLTQQLTLARMHITKDLLNVFPQVKRYPYFVYSRNGSQYSYTKIINYESIMEFVDSCRKSGIRMVSSLSELEDSSPRIKVMGLFYDQTDFMEEIEKFKSLSNYNCQKEYYLLTKKKEIKKAKEKYGEQWFAAYSLSTIVVEYPEGRFEIIDLNEIISSKVEFEEYVQSYSLPVLDEFTMVNYKLYSLQRKPILNIVLDSIKEEGASHEYLRWFKEQVACQFWGRVLFAWMEGGLNREKREMLGLEEFRPPQLAWFRIEQGSKVVYPLDVRNSTLIAEFIRDYLERPLDWVRNKYMPARRGGGEEKKVAGCSRGRGRGKGGWLVFESGEHSAGIEESMGKVRRIARRFGVGWEVCFEEGAETRVRASNREEAYSGDVGLVGQIVEYARWPVPQGYALDVEYAHYLQHYDSAFE